jgi:two-component system sensor histidine kinase/response regulator
LDRCFGAPLDSDMAKILIVDDEPVILEAITEVLSSQFELAQAEHGQAALDLLEKWNADVVISDINMAPIDGYELLERIRSSPACLSTRVVLMTGEHDEERFRRGMNRGADDYLPKPFSVDDLKQCVATQLAKQAMHRVEIERAVRRISSALPQELNTPLDEILRAAQSIATPAPGDSLESLRREAASLVGQTKRLQRSVRNLVLFSQIQAYDQAPGQWSTQGECRHARELIEGTARAEAAQANRQKDLDLALTEAAPRVSADLLQKVIQEIVGNAFKFSAAGTPVHIKMSVAGGHCQIRVQNAGPGMTSEQIKAIDSFIPFTAPAGKHSGIGLGLYLSKRLVEIHRGKFQIESFPMGPTRIMLTFELVQ